MKDQTLICQNCQSEFVWSADEQHSTLIHPAPIHPAPIHPAPIHPAPIHPAPTGAGPTLCPICRSLKLQETKIPPKPDFSTSQPPPTSHKK